MKYIQPQVLLKSFTCPHCGTIAMQTWWARNWDLEQYARPEQNPIRVGTCSHCEKNTFWVMDTMHFPDTGAAQFPNPEMPESVKKLYTAMMQFIPDKLILTIQKQYLNYLI